MRRPWIPRARAAVHWGIAGLVRSFNRNPWTHERLHLIPRHLTYEQDGLWTVHNRAFTDAAEFRRAYARAVRAGGWDYEIEWRIHVILWAALLAEPLDGAFVECGTGRGFMASAVCERLKWADRPFYLFDTFTPHLPTPDTAHGSTGLARVYADGPEPVKANFGEWAGVQLVVGRIPDSLLNAAIDQVAFLHIDLNHPAPEEAALRHFWPKLVPGGVIVFDDYAYAGYEASHASADRLASELGFSILSLPTGQGLAIKSRLS